jgi:hypothetical protein
MRFRESPLSEPAAVAHRSAQPRKCPAHRNAQNLRRSSRSRSIMAPSAQRAVRWLLPDFLSRPVFVEFVSQLLQGSRLSGPNSAGQDSDGASDLSIGADIVVEQRPH